MAHVVTAAETLEEKLTQELGFDDHFHEHHHGDKFQSNFLTTYIFSTDHKIIARQFLITGIFWAFIGAAMSIIFRLQLGFPEADMAWLKPILGKWITVNEAGIGKLDPEFYYSLVTMHGTILVFFVLTAGLSGTFANLLIPLQVGARDMASPLLNAMSYWFFFLAGLVLFLSLFLSTGPFSGGWTAYPPLSALGQASDGSKAGMTMWIVGMSFFVVSSLLGGINYITTILNLRTKGMNMWRMPLTIWAIFITAILGVLSFPVLFSGLLLLMFDRSLGTSFYLSEIVVGGQILDRIGGSPVLYQHLFWFLGHPEVYIIILPAMGIVSEVLSVHARKPIFGYRAMVYSILAIAFLSFIVWAHHMFMAGVNPFISNFFVVFTLIIAVPSAIKVFNWISTVYGSNFRFNSASLFAIGFVSMFISGGLTGIFLGNSAIDIQLHDTYFVVAHFHIVMGIARYVRRSVQLVSENVRPLHERNAGQDPLLGHPGRRLRDLLADALYRHGRCAAPLLQHRELQFVQAIRRTEPVHYGGCHCGVLPAGAVHHQLLLFHLQRPQTHREEPLGRQHAGMDHTDQGRPRQLAG